MSLDELISVHDTEIRVMKSPWSFGVDVLIKQGNNVVSDITFREYNGGEIVNPTFNLNTNNAQRLMDELWIAGFRPSEGSGSAGALKATEKHLEDMRSLVFNKMNLIDREK
jgi:hypothetical protein